MSTAKTNAVLHQPVSCMACLSRLSLTMAPNLHKAFMKGNGVNHTHNSSYHPSSNGAVDISSRHSNKQRRQVIRKATPCLIIWLTSFSHIVPHHMPQPTEFYALCFFNVSYALGSPCFISAQRHRFTRSKLIKCHITNNTPDPGILVLDRTLWSRTTDRAPSGLKVFSPNC